MKDFHTEGGKLIGEGRENTALQVDLRFVYIISRHQKFVLGFDF
jgi:hypothetical protein